VHHANDHESRGPDVLDDVGVGFEIHRSAGLARLLVATSFIDRGISYGEPGVSERSIER
jgi:hypothetical protein